MLYDPKWEVKADPFSLESLIAWLEKQPGDRPYCYLDNGFCLVSQYLIASGFESPEVFPHYFYHGKSMEQKSYPYEFNLIARRFDSALPNDGRTFGAALERARAALAQH